MAGKAKPFADRLDEQMATCSIDECRGIVRQAQQALKFRELQANAHTPPTNSPTSPTDIGGKKVTGD